MTTSPPPDDVPDDLDPDDEAVLAVLDNTATADQRRRVARDPDLRSRLAAQGAAAEAVAAPLDALDEADAGRLRAAALAALDAAGSSTDTQDRSDRATDAADEEPDERPAVTPLPARRPGRRLPPWPAVAAVVLLLVGVGLALILSDRSGDLTAERTADDAAAEQEARDLGAEAASGEGPQNDAGDGAADERDSGEESAPSANASSADLPSYSDEAALREALEVIDPDTLRSSSTTADGDAAEQASEQAAFCEQGIRAVLPELGATQAALLVRVDDQEVLVISNPVAATAQRAASTRLTALDARSCTPLFAVQR